MRANPLTQVTRVDQNTDPGDRRVKQTDRQTDRQTERMKYYFFDVKHSQKDKENRVLNEGTIQRPVLHISLFLFMYVCMYVRSTGRCIVPSFSTLFILSF